MKMKKNNLLILAVAALGFAACANDETTAVNEKLAESNAISFRTLVAGQMRASSTYDVTSASSGETYAITKFKVTSFLNGSTTKYMDGVTYVSNGATPPVFYVDGTSAAANNYKNEYYWPATETLDFYAYSYYDGGAFLGTSTQVVEVAGDDAYKTFTVTPTPGDDPSHADLVYAYLPNVGKNTTYASGAKKYGKDGIPLNFRHTGAKIAVKVKNSSSNLKFHIDAWKVAYLDGSGTFTFSTAGGSTAVKDAAQLGAGLWTNNTTALVSTEYASTTLNTDVAVNTAAAADLGGAFILVPQTLTDNTSTKTYSGTATTDKPSGTYIAVKLYILDDDTNVLIAGGGSTGSATTIWAIWPISGTWNPGKKYTYTIDLAGGGYFETNQAGTTDALDPILENTVIKFVDVTVDDWSNADAINVSGPTL